MSEVLEVKNVEKYYGNKSNLTKAIDNISFKVEEGEFLTIIGSSGCGKTTMLKMVNGLIRPDAGNVMVKGKDIADTDLI